jgi:hypothetical protein
MRRIIVTTLLLLLTAVPAFTEPDKQNASAEWAKKDYLFEVVRHLYRWYLDERDLEKVVGKQNIAFWVRELQPTLDPGDKSRFGEIVMPDMNVKVTVKRPDYSIEELGLLVRGDTFKIINVSSSHLPADAAGYTVVTTSYQAMRDYAHRTRTQTRFAEENLLVRMRLSARRHFLDYFESRQKDDSEAASKLDELKQQSQIVHLAPLSDVANEAWIFWETGRLLIRFSSDIDLENPAFLEHDALAVELFNIDEQTVVSLDEVAGSNAYITRDQVGRVLFNCIVLGKRLTLQTLDDAEVVEEQSD